MGRKKGETTAYKSVLAMRKLGYMAETTEHRMGKFRKDLFDVFDAIAMKPSEPAIMIQAYHKKEAESHAHLNASHPAIGVWLATGNLFEHHIWNFRTSKGRRYWSVERKAITI